MKNFIIYDDSKYQPGLCPNGGYYAFWATYDWVAGEKGKPGHYDKQSSPETCEMHSTCTSQVTVEEALSDLLTAVSRLKERPDYFDGPVFRVTVG